MTHSANVRIAGVAFVLGLLLTLQPLAGGGPSLSAQTGDALRVLEQASSRYADVRSFCGQFDQEMRVPLLQQVTRSHGRLCQARPDRFLMDFEDPESDIVVADGTYLWVYFPSTDPGQVFRTDLGRTDGRFDFHREFLENPGEKYDPEHLGTEEVEGHGTEVVELSPRDPASPYRSATVWIDAETFLIRKVQIEEENESVRTVVLRDLELEPTLPGDLFEFEPPPGVQVITR